METLTTEKAGKIEQEEKGGKAPSYLSRMRAEFDRLMERFARKWSAAWGDGEGWRWGLEVKQEDDRVIVQAEAPGFEPGDLDVRLDDSRLILKACKKEEVKEEGKRYEARERRYYESVQLPPGIEKDKVEATYHNGVLTVTLPRTAQARAKHIPVKQA